jgi:hypothetical protein
VASLALIAMTSLCVDGICVTAASAGEEIDIGSSLALARENLQAKQSKIAIDAVEGLWHILVAQQAGRIVNMLFEEERLRYISYEFYRGSSGANMGSMAHCNASFDTAVALISKTHGTGELTRVMTWPERQFTMTWHDDQHYAVAREISDLDGCLLVKAMIFDGNEADFKAFDQRLKQQAPKLPDAP